MISILFLGLFIKCFSVDSLILNAEQVRLTRVFDFYGNETFLNAFLFDDKYSKQVGDWMKTTRGFSTSSQAARVRLTHLLNMNHLPLSSYKSFDGSSVTKFW